MKHNPLTLIYMLLLLSLALFTGLYVTVHFSYVELPYGLAPPSVSEEFSVTYFIIGVIIMTGVFYLFTRLKYERFLKLWFSAAIFISLSVSFSVFLGEVMGLILSLVSTVLRLSSKDLYVHNLTELFIYGGIVSLFAPLFSPFSALILLVIISVYDYVSVFITKHMIYLAKSQDTVNVFTGLVIRRDSDMAILGGGDIAFSLLFATVLGTVYGVIHAYLTVYFVLTAIACLTILGEKGKFYPAMPFVTIACIASYLTVL